MKHNCITGLRISKWSTPPGYINHGVLDKIHNDYGYWHDGGYFFYVKDYRGNVRVVLDQNNQPVELNSYYPYGSLMAATTAEGVQSRKYGAKELDRENGIDLYDSNARWYDSMLDRTTTPDPLAEKYYSMSPYMWCAGNPVKFVDPNGCEITGASKADAKRFRDDIYSVLADEKFSEFRKLISVHGNTLTRIGKSDFAQSLNGVELSQDEYAYIKIVVNAVNSEQVHIVEYLDDNEILSQKGADAFRDDMNSKQQGFGDMLKTKEGTFLAKTVLGIGKGALNVPTKNGSYSFVPKAEKSDGLPRCILSGHELLGHGIPSANKETPENNNNQAIRTENLIRRILGLAQNDGTNHNGHITNPYILPNYDY